MTLALVSPLSTGARSFDFQSILTHSSLGLLSALSLLLPQYTLRKMYFVSAFGFFS